MHGGDGQNSLWQQSDLLDLVAAPAPRDQSAVPPTPRAAPEQPPVATEKAGGDADPARRTGHAGNTGRGGRADHNKDDETQNGHDTGGDNGTRGHGVTLQDTSRGPSATRGEVTGTSQPTPAPGLPPADPRAAAIPDAEVHPKGASRRPSPPPQPQPGDLTALPACPGRLLILDTETTGLTPQEGQCIEVGAVLFDVTSRSVLMQVSFLLPCEHNPAQPINGIPAAVSRLNQPWRSGLACFEAMVADADAVLAHNAAFDRQWFGDGALPALSKPWICSMEDIRWPAERQLRATPSVRDLALAYGVPVWAAHRALTDCIYLVQVFQRCDELEALLQGALEPRRLVRARVSYDERQLAKDAGFRWNEPVPRAWSRRMSEREIAALPFAVDPVEPEEPGQRRGESPAPLWRRSA